MDLGVGVWMGISGLRRGAVVVVFWQQICCLRVARVEVWEEIQVGRLGRDFSKAGGCMVWNLGDSWHSMVKRLEN